MFFLTAAQLVPQATEPGFDIYDARVCTPQSPCLAPPSPVPAGCSSADTCHPAPPAAQAPFAAGGSAAFSGAGNLSPPHGQAGSQGGREERQAADPRAEARQGAAGMPQDPRPLGEETPDVRSARQEAVRTQAEGEEEGGRKVMRRPLVVFAASLCCGRWRSLRRRSRRRRGGMSTAKCCRAICRRRARAQIVCGGEQHRRRAGQWEHGTGQDHRQLPEGLTATGYDHGARGRCSDLQTLQCTYTREPDPVCSMLTVTIKVAVRKSRKGPSTLSNRVSVEGGGAPRSASVQHVTLGGDNTVRHSGLRIVAAGRRRVARHAGGLASLRSSSRTLVMNQTGQGRAGCRWRCRRICASLCRPA